MEVKASQNRYPKAKKQLLHAEEKIKEIFAAIGIALNWKFVGVFFAENGSEKSIFDNNCPDCLKFVIIGSENITDSLSHVTQS